MTFPLPSTRNVCGRREQVRGQIGRVWGHSEKLKIKEMGDRWFQRVSQSLIKSRWDWDLWLVVGVQLLQGGVKMSLGWFPENIWEGLLLLQVWAGFGEGIALYLSVKDESESFELFRQRAWAQSWPGCLFYYLLLFFLPSLLLLFFGLAYLLQRGRCERSQELFTNRGQQRGKPAILQSGANRSIILQLFSVEKEKRDEEQVQKIWW